MSLEGQQAYAWAVLSAGAAAGAGLATRWVLRRGWDAVLGDGAAEDPSAPDVRWRSALLWAVVSGVCVGGARVIAKRLAADAFEHVAGRAPPE